MTELLGPLRDELSLGLQALLGRVIDNNQQKESYYILVVISSPKDKVIKTSLVLLNKKPKKLLNTLCYFVDNKNGLIKRIWALPMDIAIPEMLLTGEGVEEAYRSGQGMPIFNKD
ncbi:MAG: hypothetical protein M0R74_16970 [Dehalococcoidia bacterium]|jgi:hypothetical protein|nr:hypothetical protein [Dehalococcoidia bacterium]